MVAGERKIGRRPETKEPTERQVEILRDLALGLTQVEIAANLGLSIGTIESEMRRVFEFFKTSDETQAVVNALNQGRLDLSALVQGVNLSIFADLQPEEKRLLQTMHAAYQAGNAAKQKDLARTLGEKGKKVENQFTGIYSKLKALGVIDIDRKRPTTRLVVLYYAYQKNPLPPLSRDYY